MKNKLVGSGQINMLVFIERAVAQRFHYVNGAVVHEVYPSRSFIVWKVRTPVLDRVDRGEASKKRKKNTLRGRCSVFQA